MSSAPPTVISFPDDDDAHRPAHHGPQSPTSTHERDARAAYRDVAAASKTPWTHLLSTVMWVVIVVAGSIVDAILILPALDRTIRVDREFSVIFSFIIALVAATLAWSAGATFWKAMHSRVEKVAAWGLLGMWALLGVALFGLRLIAASTHQSAVPEWAMAIVLLLIYIAVGAGALHAGYSLNNPALRAYVAAQRRLERARPKLESAEVELVGSLAALTICVYRQRAVTDERIAALRETHDVADQLRALARVLVAQHLGDPAETGLIRKPFDPSDADPSGRSGSTDPDDNPTDPTQA